MIAGEMVFQTKGGFPLIEANIYKTTKQWKRAVRESGKEHVVVLDDSPIRYRVIGKGPSILVLHGMFHTAYDFHRLCNNLAKFFTVYAIKQHDRGNKAVQGWITLCKKTG
jgi:hypothetical protein